LLGQIRRMSPTSPEVTRARILLVEDDPEAALFAVHVLTKRAQFDVTHTADPAVALDLAAAGHWDLVLTDFEMPGMTGLELLHALRQVAPALPVAVVTAHVPAGMTHTALLSEADAYLSKPLRIDQLISTATDLIRNGRKTCSTRGDGG
jgi:two-component system, cell cycle sensor histidine kinase and response regulator CckA